MLLLPLLRRTAKKKTTHKLEAKSAKTHLQSNTTATCLPCTANPHSSFTCTDSFSKCNRHVCAYKKCFALVPEIFFNQVN